MSSLALTFGSDIFVLLTTQHHALHLAGPRGLQAPVPSPCLLTLCLQAKLLLALYGQMERAYGRGELVQERSREGELKEQHDGTFSRLGF